MDHNDRIGWEQNTSSVFPDKVLNRRTGSKKPSQRFRTDVHIVARKWNKPVRSWSVPYLRREDVCFSPERSEESASSRAAYGRGSPGRPRTPQGPVSHAAEPQGGPRTRQWARTHATEALADHGCHQDRSLPVLQESRSKHRYCRQPPGIPRKPWRDTDATKTAACRCCRSHGQNIGIVASPLACRRSARRRA